nr:hypothetical protein [Paenibacillus sp. Soil787]
MGKQQEQSGQLKLEEIDQMLGRVADAVLAAGGKVTGVMPRNLFKGEMVHSGLR